MSSLELDLTHVRSAHDIHVALSSLLEFPAWYGHNWDGFWDLITSSHPLPARLVIRGLDHVELILSQEADRFLQCLAGYNNNTGRLCRARVTDDYRGRLFSISCEVEPTALVPRPNVHGAFINGWIKADSDQGAHAFAINALVREGWKVISDLEVSCVDLTCLADEEEDSLIRQACTDSPVFEIHTYGADDDDED
ncbi:MAG: barstar family protein [Kofleriaceae bacterium]